MNQIPLKNQIITWLKSNAYWFQYAGNEILENAEIDNHTLDKIYELFKENHGLKSMTEERPEVSFTEIAVDDAATTTPLVLTGVKEIENVNALARDQQIPIGSNLTLVYGGNGTGKSGYIRMCNNAFNSRGDKTILPNVFSTDPAGIPTCKFTFQTDAEPYDLSYPSDKDCVEFNQFSIFDTHSVRVHLEGDNQLNFTPRGFEFFERLLTLYDRLKEKLAAEITTARPTNEFLPFFVNDNAIRTLIASMNATTDEDVLKTIGTVTEGDKERLTALFAKKEELKALDIPKKIAELQSLKNEFLEFIKNQQALLDNLKADSIQEYQALISAHEKFSTLTQKEGIVAFEEFNVSEIGSPEWREFIKAAKNYSDVIDKGREGADYPTEGDNCLLCLRPLTDTENSLITAYWQLLSSEAEKELSKNITEISDTEKALSELAQSNFGEGTTTFQHANNLSPEIAQKWKTLAESSEQSRKDIILNLASRNFDKPFVSFTDNTEEISTIANNIQTTIDDLFKADPVKELGEIEVEILMLTDKSLMEKLIAQLLAFVASHKWAAAADRASATFNTKSITIKQGEFFSAHITEKYAEKFNEECEKLNAPKIVNIVQKNVKSTTLRKLQVGGAVANSVLSEGEQRAISLADFFTETEINPNNKGVVFDDPVTSQDHLRRERIAQRLVELAQNKQVVVFTHDVAFFVALKIMTEKINLPLTITTIRNAMGLPGVIKPDLPWVAQNIKSRIGFLKDRLVRLKKVEDGGDADEYFYQAKAWYTFLREAWERAVEERLFKGVVERFGIGVQTLRLKNIVITPELLADIEKGMTDSSNWVHDASMGLNPTPPDTAKAAIDLKFLEDFATKCGA